MPTAVALLPWVVDTSVLVDIYSGDADSPVSYVELAPAFEGDAALQGQFLAEVAMALLVDAGGHRVSARTLDQSRRKEALRARRQASCR